MGILETIQRRTGIKWRRLHRVLQRNETIREASYGQNNESVSCFRQHRISTSRHFQTSLLIWYRLISVIKSVIDKISGVDGWLSAFIYGTPITYTLITMSSSAVAAQLRSIELSTRSGINDN